MKKIFKYLLMYVPVLASLPLITACSEDEAVDPYDVNYVFIYSPAETNSEMVYKGNGTFLTKVAPECSLNPVRCTKPAPERLVAHFSIDPSLVDAYNKAHGTEYTLLKSAQLEKTSLVIEAGKYISADSLKLKLTDLTEFQSGAEKYILPVTLTSVDGAGVSVSQNNKIYLTFTSTYKPNKVTIGSGASVSVKLSDGTVEEPTDPSRIAWNSMISAEWMADDDMTVHLGIDEKLIDSYNALNGTDYKMMPNAALETSVMHIKKGDFGPEETFALTFSDKMANLKVGERYIVPVVMNKVEGVGAGLSDKTTCYITFDVSELPNAYTGSAPVGTRIQDYDGWSVTLNGYSDWKKILTNPGTYLGGIWANQPLVIEMNEPKVITSFIMSYMRGYQFSGKAYIETSLDGETYKKSEVQLPYSTTHFVLFRKPVNAKFIRITYIDGTINSSYGVVLNGLRIYGPSTE